MKYPHSLRDVLRRNKFENIIDSNIFSAYITDDLPIPRIDDPRKTQASPEGIPRHPSYVRSPQINQIFSYIGYIKRIRDSSLRKYLPVLYSELTRFLHVLVDIIFRLDFTLSEDIYSEQKLGLQQFLGMYERRKSDDFDWIKSIWKHQRLYLDNLSRILESLKRRGQVFDYKKEDELYEEIVSECRFYFRDKADSLSKIPGDTDISFVANCCLKAKHDGEQKTIWSSDGDIKRIIRAIYNQPRLANCFPQIYLRAGYQPKFYTQLFP